MCLFWSLKTKLYSNTEPWWLSSIESHSINNQDTISAGQWIESGCFCMHLQIINSSFSYVGVVGQDQSTYGSSPHTNNCMEIVMYKSQLPGAKMWRKKPTKIVYKLDLIDILDPLLSSKFESSRQNLLKCIQL